MPRRMRVRATTQCRRSSSLAHLTSPPPPDPELEVRVRMQTVRCLGPRAFTSHADKSKPTLRIATCVEMAAAHVRLRDPRQDHHPRTEESDSAAAQNTLASEYGVQVQGSGFRVRGRGLRGSRFGARGSEVRTQGLRARAGACRFWDQKTLGRGDSRHPRDPSCGRGDS
eukprot:959452-Rhodomonas_salina.1